MFQEDIEKRMSLSPSLPLLEEFNKPGFHPEDVLSLVNIDGTEGLLDLYDKVI